MRKNKAFPLILLIIIFIGGYYFMHSYFSSSNRSLEKEISNISLSADKLVEYYLLNEEKSNKLYTGKIITIDGLIKKVSFLNNRNTIILYTKNNDSGIICDVNPNQIDKMKTLKKHQKIRVKGICKGFLKDVILLNCYLDLEPNE